MKCLTVGGLSFVPTPVIEDQTSYEFSPNIDLINDAQQVKLSKTRVAVAGVGGVCGRHLLTLVRLGIGQFTIADIDIYERVNINRQFGNKHKTSDEHRADVITELLMDIKPKFVTINFS